MAASNWRRHITIWQIDRGGRCSPRKPGFRHGLVAGYERRGEGWQHEVNMASKTSPRSTRNWSAPISASPRAKGLAIHNKTIAQNQQVADFYTSRFSNIALYTWLRRR